MKFIDEAPLILSSGRGGPGAVTFRREKYVPRGGPDGGDGGKGGDVIFRVNTRKHSLLDFKFKKQYAAPNGQPGAAANCSGADGSDLILEVPPGTVIKDHEGKTIIDLGEKGEMTFLLGGRGGKGNAFFANSVNQAPDYAQPGEEGKTVEILLELKLIADVGIVGYPNAGKSTLISRISEAKPKIADYPFTTLVPNLGVVRVAESASFVVADMPGLIPGAHKGVGLGTQFLKHIERTKVFIHLIDASEFSGRDPEQDFEDIVYELKMYDEGKKSDPEYRPLMGRSQIVVLNKIDLLDADRLNVLISKFKKRTPNVFTISAVTGKGIKELIEITGDMVIGAR